MSPLIEEARRRQRRRRIVVAALVVAAVAVAAVLAVVRGSSDAPERQAQPAAATITKSVPGFHLYLAPANNPSGEPATVLRAVVTGVAHRYYGKSLVVRVDPKTGVVTTTAP